VRAYYKPLITLVWLGALVMSLGGLVSLTDRRLRIGLAQRARKRAAGVAAEPAA
jgi:cytochrome c-type biogenesis protein CcmF